MKRIRFSILSLFVVATIAAFLIWGLLSLRGEPAYSHFLKQEWGLVMRKPNGKGNWWFVVTLRPMPKDEMVQALTFLVDNNAPWMELNLYDSEIDLECAKAISKMHWLKILNFRDCSLNDKIVVELSKMKRLRRIGISGRYITDESIEHLSKMESLEELFIGRDTKISLEGVSRLKTLRPDMKIKAPAQEGKEKENVEPVFPFDPSFLDERKGLENF
jgi:hypothetical protein